MESLDDQLDIDFKEYIILPSETYADTMRLNFGWKSIVRDKDGRLIEGYSFIADTDGVDQHIRAMQRFAAATYVEFGGGETDQPISVSFDEVLDYVTDYKNQERFGVYAFEDEIATLAHRYLLGVGDAPEEFEEIVNLHFPKRI
jgi:hypothetical protein